MLIDYTYREISCFGTLVPLFWLTLYVDKRWPKTAQLMVSKSHDDEVLSFPPPCYLVVAVVKVHTYKIYYVVQGTCLNDSSYK